MPSYSPFNVSTFFLSRPVILVPGGGVLKTLFSMSSKPKISSAVIRTPCDPIVASSVGMGYVSVSLQVLPSMSARLTFILMITDVASDVRNALIASVSVVMGANATGAAVLLQSLGLILSCLVSFCNSWDVITP